MSEPVSRTTDDDDLLLRFLSAAETRIKEHNNRVPFNIEHGIPVIGWLRALVGRLNDDGSIN